MNRLFAGSYYGKRVLITGHTGFKGSWLSLWLSSLGADVVGYSLPLKTSPNHFDLLNIDIHSVYGDIRDKENIEKTFKSFRPDIVFHLAAQPLVLKSYNNPYDTFDTNVMGTIRVFEACRATDSVTAILNITSDKCYENKEWVWGYRENDPMGGYDPYSASKGCSELVTASYRNSYFNLSDYKKKHGILLASCRAGNVIGGGDWSEDRLVPDIIKAASSGKKVFIRNPHAIRPWQHVLESLSGYLLLGQKLIEGKQEYADCWNFGPENKFNISVIEAVGHIRNHWDKITYEVQESINKAHEAFCLKLDSTKANTILGWDNVWDAAKAFEKTSLWYREFYNSGTILSRKNLKDYILAAKEKKVSWAIDY